MYIFYILTLFFSRARESIYSKIIYIYTLSRAGEDKNMDKLLIIHHEGISIKLPEIIANKTEDIPKELSR